MMAEIEHMVHSEDNMQLSTNQYKYGFLNIRKQLKIHPPQQSNIRHTSSQNLSIPYFHLDASQRMPENYKS
jgi:hypothetical protein